MGYKIEIKKEHFKSEGVVLCDFPTNLMVGLTAVDKGSHLFSGELAKGTHKFHEGILKDNLSKLSPNETAVILLLQTNIEDSKKVAYVASRNTDASKAVKELESYMQKDSHVDLDYFKPVILVGSMQEVSLTRGFTPNPFGSDKLLLNTEEALKFHHAIEWLKGAEKDLKTNISKNPLD